MRSVFFARRAIAPAREPAFGVPTDVFHFGQQFNFLRLELGDSLARIRSWCQFATDGAQLDGDMVGLP